MCTLAQSGLGHCSIPGTSPPTPPVIHPSAARRATVLLLNAGLIPKNGSCFSTPSVGAEKQGKHSDAAMMPFYGPYRRYSWRQARRRVPADGSARDPGWRESRRPCGVSRRGA
jgi:hypothetical protein